MTQGATICAGAFLPQVNYNTEKVETTCVCVCVCVHAHVCAQFCPTLRNPMDCSSPGSFLHAIFQARILEWVAISYSRGIRC